MSLNLTQRKRFHIRLSWVRYECNSLLITVINFNSSLFSVFHLAIYGPVDGWS